MAGAENLKGHGFHERTADEAREISRAGGIASGAARRKKRAMKQVAAAMLAAPVSEADADKLAAYGVAADDADYQAMVVAALIKKAAGGNVRAIEALLVLTGDDPYVKARQAEVRVKQAELKEKIRQFDATTQMKMDALGDSDSDKAVDAWLDEVIAAHDEWQAVDADAGTFMDGALQAVDSEGDV